MESNDSLKEGSRNVNVSEIKNGYEVNSYVAITTALLLLARVLLNAGSEIGIPAKEKLILESIFQLSINYFLVSNIAFYLVERAIKRRMLKTNQPTN